MAGSCHTKSPFFACLWFLLSVFPSLRLNFFVKCDGDGRKKAKAQQRDLQELLKKQTTTEEQNLTKSQLTTLLIKINGALRCQTDSKIS